MPNGVRKSEYNIFVIFLGLRQHAPSYTVRLKCSVFSLHVYGCIVKWTVSNGVKSLVLVNCRKSELVSFKLYIVSELTTGTS